METDESVLDSLSVAESSGELGYSGLATPSPPFSLDGNSPASATTLDNEDDDSIYPRITHVQSVNIKVEPLDDNEDTDQVRMQLKMKEHGHFMCYFYQNSKSLALIWYSA